MIDTELPKFNCKEINREIEAAKKLLNDNELSLDKVSDDIKKLEKYLRDKNIGLTYEYTFRVEGRLAHSLTWGIIKGSFRLFYTKIKESDNSHIQDDQIFEKRPLIEMPVDTRLEVHSHLPNFLKCFFKKIKERTYSEIRLSH